MDMAHFIERLTDAVELYDRAEVGSLCAELSSHLSGTEDPVSPGEADRILTLLLRRRFFELLTDVADSMLQSGSGSPIVHLSYAQALIDQGLLSAGEAVLHSARPGVLDDAKMLAELEGILGRAYKQMFLSAGAGTARRARFFTQALEAYGRGEAVADGSSRWHTINRIALSMRGRREGLPGVTDRTAESAHDTISQIQRRY